MTTVSRKESLEDTWLRPPDLICSGVRRSGKTEAKGSLSSCHLRSKLGHKEFVKNCVMPSKSRMLPQYKTIWVVFNFYSSQFLRKLCQLDDLSYRIGSNGI